MSHVVAFHSSQRAVLADKIAPRRQRRARQSPGRCFKSFESLFPDLASRKLGTLPSILNRRPNELERLMPTWMQCTTADGNEIRINLDHVVTIRPYQKDRGGKGSEITFVGGTPSSLVVREDQDCIASARQTSTTDRLDAEPRRNCGEDIQ
jgi:hypothetical protein